jgi:hypothetical protein
MEPFFNFCKFDILKFQKILEKNPTCSQWCILQSCKIPKWNSLYSRLHKKRQNLRNLKILEFDTVHRLRSENLLFFTQHKIHNILYWFFCIQLKSISIYTLEYFLLLFETLNFRFLKKFKKQAPWNPCSKLTFSPCVSRWTSRPVFFTSGRSRVKDACKRTSGDMPTWHKGNTSKLLENTSTTVVPKMLATGMHPF